MKRRKLTQSERKLIYAKCRGHCAYCGSALRYQDMQVDHATPLKIGGRDCLENMLPTCRSCNHYKGTLDVEGFRNYLGDIFRRLMRDCIPFQVAMRFGIVEYVEDEISFYYEK